MTDATSALRLGQPRPEAYETSTGELAVLRGMDPKNIGMMGGILLGQRGDAQQRMADYSRQLNTTNAQQAQLGLKELAEAGRIADGKIGAQMYEHGLPGSVALQMAQPGALQIGDMEPDQARRVVLDSDGVRRAGAVAKGVRDTGAGMKDLGDAGVLVNPGQTVATPADAANVRMTTGTPIPITLRAMQEAGANSRDNNGTATALKPKTVIKIDPVSNVPTIEIQNPTSDEDGYRRADEFARRARGELPSNNPPANPTQAQPPPGGAPTGPAEVSPSALRLLQGGGGSATPARVSPSSPLAGDLPGTRGIAPPAQGSRNAPAPAPVAMRPPVGGQAPVSIQNKALGLREQIGDAKSYKWKSDSGWTVFGTKGSAVLGNG